MHPAFSPSSHQAHAAWGCQERWKGTPLQALGYHPALCSHTAWLVGRCTGEQHIQSGISWQRTARGSLYPTGSLSTWTAHLLEEGGLGFELMGTEQWGEGGTSGTLTRDQSHALQNPGASAQSRDSYQGQELLHWSLFLNTQREPASRDKRSPAWARLSGATCVFCSVVR